MTTLRTTRWPLALALVCVAIACKKPAPPADDEPKPKGGAAAKKGGASAEPGEDDGEDAAAKADDALAGKLDLYVRDCLNTFSRSIYDSESRYFLWVDPKAGVTGKERFVYGLYKISGDTAKCTKSVETANAKKPRDAKLEAAATAYEKAIADAVPIFNEAHKYYDQKDYGDDKFKKAKELHPKLVAAFEAFAKADKELGAQVDGLQVGLEKRDLTRIEKSEGKKARWHTKGSLLLGKALIKAADQPFEKIDASAYQTVLDEYVAAIDAFEKWRDKNKDDRDASNSSSYFGSSQDVVKKGKDLGRRLRDKKAFDAAEKRSLGTQSGWMVEGSPDALFHEWSEAVRDYNSIHWAR